jgi:hypothetical protein
MQLRSGKVLESKSTIISSFIGSNLNKSENKSENVVVWCSPYIPYDSEDEADSNERSSIVIKKNNKEEGKKSNVREWFFDSLKKSMKIIDKYPSNTKDRIVKYQEMCSLFTMININMEDVLIKSKFTYSILKIFSTIKTKLYDLIQQCDSSLDESNYRLYERGSKVRALITDLKLIVNTCYTNVCKLSDKYSVSQKLMEFINVKVVKKAVSADLLN